MIMNRKQTSKFSHSTLPLHSLPSFTSLLFSIVLITISYIIYLLGYCLSPPHQRSLHVHSLPQYQDVMSKRADTLVCFVHHCTLIVITAWHIVGTSEIEKSKHFESACQCRRCGFDPWVREDPLEQASRSSILAWKIPWIEESGGLQCMGSKRARHD